MEEELGWTTKRLLLLNFCFFFGLLFYERTSGNGYDYCLLVIS